MSDMSVLKYAFVMYSAGFHLSFSEINLTIDEFSQFISRNSMVTDYLPFFALSFFT